MKQPPLPLEEAQDRLLALVDPLPIERCDIAGAIGRYLAEPLTARRTHPPADCSAMDGYAVAPHDLAGPWRVIGESAAGHPFTGACPAGAAVRISTGALVPAGAGAVILQEDVVRDGVCLTRSSPDAPSGSRHVRSLGLDFTEGAALLEAGTRIGPAQAALAIAAGHKHLAVRRRPRVAILDCGDELCPEDEACAVHQVPASNGPMLAAMAAGLPCDISRLGPVPDDLDRLADALAEAGEADLVVTSGGASVGDHDLIRPAVEAWGAEVDFWRIAIKPGKPLLVAARERDGRRQIFLGLPGNPASSYVTAYFFMLPVLRAMLGAANPLPRLITASLGAPLGPGGSRREFLRGRWDGATIVAQPLQDSGVLAALAASNALIDRGAKAPPGAVGETVSAYLLENGGIA
ncbi:MAG: molybdopterin molybdotransferase MoeA [Novosphingobium sp.]